MRADVSVRLAEKNDYDFIVNYFLTGSAEFHLGMGVESSKLPLKHDWLKLLYENHDREIQQKDFFYVIWLVNNEPVGHSNINKIVYGQEAYMHLHMWRADIRSKGLGLELVRQSIPYYFENFELQRLWCEPYALNPAPNKTLPKLGFELIKSYETIPGWISFHQPVKRWCMDASKFKSLYLP
jgi:RimJ/RimL family protein N-acetyltransferase